MQPKFGVGIASPTPNFCKSVISVGTHLPFCFQWAQISAMQTKYDLCTANGVDMYSILSQYFEGEEG